jgi:dipeptidyl aminopeptidase/acylaminoacyl peptidase
VFRMQCNDIFGFSQIAEAAISPGGDAVAFVQRMANRGLDSYESELRIAQIPGASGSECCRSAGNGLRGPVWAPDGRTLAAVERQPGEVTDSLVIVSALDSRRRRLISRLVGPASLAWSPDGIEVGFLAVSSGGDHAVTARSAELNAASRATVVRDFSARIDGLGTAGSWRRHLFTVNRETGVVRQLTDGDLWVEDFCYSPSSRLIALCGSEPWSGSTPRQPGAVRPSQLWIMARDAGPMRPIAIGEVSARSLLFAGDSQLVLIGGPQQRADLQGLYAVPVEGGPVRRLAGSLDRGVVTGSARFLDVDQAGGQLVFCARDGGCVQLYQIRLSDSAGIQTVAGTAVESISAPSASRRGVRLAYVSSTADGHQRLIVHDLNSGQRNVLAETAPPAEVLPVTREEFTARDGLVLEGWLIRRNPSGSTPLLVDVHGGSFSGAWSPIIQPSRLYQQELAVNGWTVLLLNTRGSDGYGSEFARAAIGAWGEADAPDIHDAIDELIRRKLVDPAELAVTGYSYGGFMSNWLTATSDRFSAAVSGGSICDFVSLFGTSDMGWAMSEYDIGVQPGLDPLGALRRSPAGLGRPIRTPTLLLHGEADLRCPISQAEEWLGLLLAVGCEAELVRYPAASHGFLTEGPPSLAADYGNRLVRWVTDHRQVLSGERQHEAAHSWPPCHDHHPRR